MAAFITSSGLLLPLAAPADVLEGIAKQLTRPENVSPLMAVVQLQDAASTLQEIQVCMPLLFWALSTQGRQVTHILWSMLHLLQKSTVAASNQQN